MIKNSLLAISVWLLVGIVSVCVFGVPNVTIAQGRPEALPAPALSHIPVCPPGPASDQARCHARVIVDKGGHPRTTTSPTGYGSAQFQGAYGLGGSSNNILAIVDAYNHPTIKSDLDTYSSAMGLPILPTCSGSIASSSVPCFQKVDQNGGSSYPSTSSGWALEIALDVEAAHAGCPGCKLLLVEAASSSYGNLMTAVDRAVALGATVVSNSYGSGEFSSETNYDSHFNHPGVAFVFSSGDNGYGSSYPAASKYVTAAGGTTLNVTANGDGTYSYSSEKAWSGSGSGCSYYESKPSWQPYVSGCSKRAIADVSAVADPNTGAAVYDSVPYSGQSGWFQVGGTSLSAPLIAAAYALKGIPSGVQANSLPYLNNPGANLHDVTSGSNGGCGFFKKALCNAGTGYDGPTGLGTPNGVNAF